MTSAAVVIGALKVNILAHHLMFIFLCTISAMQQKPIGESRIPTDFWSGLGFSKSMPESVIRERMAQTGIKQRYESSMATTYEVSSFYIGLELYRLLFILF